MAKVKYIIGHWTGASSYNVSEYIKNCYQLIITRNGDAIKGYKGVGETASTAGMNSITYNISCAGDNLSAPLTRKQCERFFYECAFMLKHYDLTVDKFYTHAEIGNMYKNGTITKLLPMNKWLKNNEGKIDLTKLPYDFKGKSHGDFIRSKIKWYYNELFK